MTSVVGINQNYIRITLGVILFIGITRITSKLKRNGREISDRQLIKQNSFNVNGGPWRKANRAGIAWELCPTFQLLINGGNRTPDPLIFSPSSHTWRLMLSLETYLYWWCHRQQQHQDPWESSVGCVIDIHHYRSGFTYAVEVLDSLIANICKVHRCWEHIYTPPFHISDFGLLNV